MVAAFAELLGREGGINAGRGGSAYFTAPDYGFYGENSIVAGSAPLAVGAALAARYDGSGRVAVVSFGDGALNQGAMHEAMNFASAFSLPVVFMCENNGYSELTPIADMVADDQLYRRASAYGMPGVRIDGNDVAAVSSAVSEAAERGRSGGGPTLIEAMTERLVGHYIGDIEHYRPEGEVDRAREHEPIVVLRRTLIDAGITAETCDDALRLAVEQVRQAAEAALSQPLATTADVREYLYA
jgi:pyruvate dehydrogenase E1 component alpha subunit